MIRRPTNSFAQKHKVMKYNDIITQNGEKYGLKTANLLFLDDELKNYLCNIDAQKLSTEFSAGIPVFFPISHEDIVNHLDQYAANWRHLWDEFVSAYNKQEEENKQIITDIATDQLRKLQRIIIECFDKHGFVATSQLQDKINANDLLMVRSTGKEDSTELANPGGNDSKTCVKFNSQAISKAIGEVVASYMGIKSLSQRLKAGNDITQFPFIPVLIQKMINVAYSGVMYSDNGCTRIQIAPGHGELIVNSKGNFDNYYITAENMVYAEIRVKHFRLAPRYNKETKTTELARVDNEPKLQYGTSLSEDAALYLHQLAQFIEAKYDMRMDIEFIYDPEAQFVHIVQARPIPLGDRKHLIPSAASIEFITEIINNKGTIINGQVITPEVNRAAVITNSASVIICDAIDEALSCYLKSKNKIKAVIVKQYAPDTSHEAGEFSSKAIPVMQVDELEIVQSLLSNVHADNPIIIDPQRKKVLMPQNELPQLQVGEDVEDILYSSGKLKEGIFKSTLTHYVTPYNYNFDEDSYQFHTYVVSEIQAEGLGTLLHKVRAKNTDATDKLLSFLFQIMNNKQADITTDSYSALLQNLDKLAVPKFGSTNQENKNILSSIVQLLANLRQQKLLSQEIFTQTLLIGGELYIMLENLEAMEYDDQHMIQYLNVLEKFTGSITADAKKDILADSVFLNVAEKQHEKAMLKLISALDFSYDQQQYFFEVTKLGRFFINPENKRHWYDFCAELCKNKVNAAKLGDMIANLVKKDLHESWINLSFLSTLQKNNDDNQQTFIELQADFSIAVKKAASLQPVYQLIQSLEAQIASWKEPDNFSKLYPEFIKTLDSIGKELRYGSGAPLLVKMLVLKYAEHLVDVLDKTIKSLEKSTLYTDKALQVERFYLLLIPFYSLMKQWVSYCTFPDRTNILWELEKFFESKMNARDARELSPSGNVAVNSAIIGQAGNFERNFVNRPNKTLEDFFSLIHQNFIKIISVLAYEYNSFLLGQISSISSVIMKGISRLNNIVSVKNEHPHITILYNVPLRNHSGSIEVQFNYIKNKIVISSRMFGHNLEMRWNKAALISYMKSIMDGMEVLYPPRYNEQNQQLKISIGLDDINKLSNAFNVINTIADFSFYENFSRINIIQNHVDILLITLNEIELNQARKFKENLMKYLAQDTTYCIPDILLPILNALQVKLKQSQNYSEKNILAETAAELINLYDKNLITVAELEKLEQPAILALIKENALLSYQNGYITASSLANIMQSDLLPHDVAIFTSFNAIEAYKIGVDSSSLFNFAKKNIKTIEVLIAPKARLAYQLGLDINSFKNLSAAEINTQISLYLINRYNVNKITKDDLQDLDQKLIEALCSEGAIQLYKTNQASFADLKTFAPNKIEALTSQQALSAYQPGYMQFKDLAPLTIEQIQFFTSESVIEVYANVKATFNDVKDISQEEFNILSRSSVQQLFLSGIGSIADFKKLDKNVREYLLSGNILRELKMKLSEFHDLTLQQAKTKIAANLAYYYLNSSSFDKNMIKLLDEEEKIYFDTAKHLFSLGIGTLANLNELDKKVIEYLFSRQISDVYNLGVKFSDFKGLTLIKVKMKIAVILTNHYSVGSNITVSDIMNIDPDKRYLFVNAEEAIRAYKTGYVKFEDLKDLDENMIELLISEDAIRAYKTTRVTISMLKNLSYDAAEKLISNVTNHYTDKSYNFYAPPQIQPGKINTATSLQEEKHRNEPS